VKLKSPPLRRHEHQTNYFRFRLGPELSLSIGARVKRPGPELVSMPVELSAVKLDRANQLEAYERLLTDAMRGDQLLFVRQDAVEAAWAIVDPILGQDTTPLHEYQPGTWGPAEAEAIAADCGGWHDPEVSE
jgi:glucose-6-phosphate 1-dehydrogenase